MKFLKTLFLYPDEETLKTLEYQGRWAGDSRDLKRERSINKDYFIWMTFGVLILTVILIVNLIGKLQMTIMGSHQTALIVTFLVIVIVSFVIIKLMGISIDGIFIDGITNRSIGRFDILIGNGLHRYEDIKTIFTGLGMQGGKYSYYIQVSKRSASEKPTMGPFVEVLFENDFYKQLETTLRERCPHAEWVEKDLL